MENSLIWHRGMIKYFLAIENKSHNCLCGAFFESITKADKINETAAPGDRVGGEQLRQRTRFNEGLFGKNCQINNQQPKEKTPAGPELKKGGEAGRI